MKKAQGISINVIIVAALALLVLVILALVFAGKIGNFRINSESCLSRGGNCVKANTCDTSKDYITKENYPCLDAQGKRDTSKECCITV